VCSSISAGNWKRSSSLAGRCGSRRNEAGHGRLVRNVECRNEIEEASRVMQECARPDWTRRFILSPGLSRGCKVRVESGSHHRPSRRCRIRGRSKTHGRHNRRMRDSGQPGTSSPGLPEGAKSGETRNPSAGAEGAKIRGDPEIHLRHSRKMQDSEKSEDSSQGGDKSMKIRGNLKIHLQSR
jgi:hypothetical protein